MKPARLVLALLAALAGPAVAQNPAADADRAAMMRALGIRALLPGVSGDPASPDAANTDEARANPHPDLPDPLRFADGRTVRTIADWRARRAEIAEVFAREVYGRVPDRLPPVAWQVVATDREVVGFGRPVVARRVIGHVRDPACPGLDVAMRMVVVLPEGARAAPVLVMFGRDVFPNPTQPTPAEFDRIDAATKAVLVAHDPVLAGVFARHQAFTFAAPAPFRFAERDAQGNGPPTEQLVAAGWGYALLDTASIQEDDGAGLRRGIVGLGNCGRARRPDDWGALRAWAWGASQARAWLQGDAVVGAVGVEGVSRYGKAALVAAAFDERFAVALVGSSGKGGATPLRRNFGEGVGNLATGEYHWMAGNFLRYDTKGVSPPQLDAGDLPVDANALLALVAPRPLFVSYGVPEAGDAPWLDQRGSWMATVDAARVYRLLGQDGAGGGQDYHRAPMPAVREALVDGALAWRQHDGGHTDAPNFPTFLRWAERWVRH